MKKYIIGIQEKRKEIRFFVFDKPYESRFFERIMKEIIKDAGVVSFTKVKETR